MEAKTIGILTLLIIFGISCTENYQPNSFNEQQVENVVARTFHSYVDHINSKGLKDTEKYFSSSDDFYWVEDGQMQYPSHDSLLANINQFYPQVDSVHFVALKTDIDVINQNLATLYTEYKQDVSLKAGYSFTLDGAMTILLRKENEGWKFLNGHSSVKKPRGDE